MFPDLAHLPEMTLDKSLLCSTSSICKMQMIMIMPLLGTVTLNQPVKQAVVLRWLALEKHEGQARTARGAFAPRKAHAALSTGLVVSYIKASLNRTRDSQLPAEDAAVVPPRAECAATLLWGPASRSPQARCWQQSLWLLLQGIHPGGLWRSKQL